MLNVVAAAVAVVAAAAAAAVVALATDADAAPKEDAAAIDIDCTTAALKAQDFEQNEITMCKPATFKNFFK